ncbi:MAG: peptidylprolyl isomerase [Cyanobacteria bacterium SZAS TMP-1]|nr:peptidylprolyl isomerase [Cyanobacteria bacterium SZAS TMP-1]
MKFSRTQLGKFNLAATLPAMAMLVVMGAGALTSTPAQAAKEKKSEDPIVEMDTTKGVIKVVIYQHDAPITANNFLDLVNRKFYDGLTFHRYEPGFCIQGGDPNGTGTGNFVDPKTGQTRYIRLEKKPNLVHDQAGMLAMARTSDPDTASCQFYFTLDPATFLDKPPGYAVFGKCIEGLDVVKSLRKGDKMTKVFIVKGAAK